jgi:hypothetical protein
MLIQSPLSIDVTSSSLWLTPGFDEDALSGNFDFVLA